MAVSYLCKFGHDEGKPPQGSHIVRGWVANGSIEPGGGEDVEQLRPGPDASDDGEGSQSGIPEEEGLPEVTCGPVLHPQGAQVDGHHVSQDGIDGQVWVGQAPGLEVLEILFALHLMVQRMDGTVTSAQDMRRCRFR